MEAEKQKATYYGDEDMTQRDHEIFNAGVNAALQIMRSLVEGIPPKALEFTGRGIAVAVQPPPLAEDDIAPTMERIETFVRWVTGRAGKAIQAVLEKNKKQIVKPTPGQVADISKARANRTR